MKQPLRKQSPERMMQLKPLLDSIHREVETRGFIQNDPVQFMHLFETKKEREIAGFLAALMAWGRRDVVLRKTNELLEIMDFQPFRYVMNYSPGAADDFIHFRHRTFRQDDLHGLISALQRVYQTHEDFEDFWDNCHAQANKQSRNLLSVFREQFLSLTTEIPAKTLRHLPDPEKNSTCKRLIMFLRWTGRKNSPVDPGIWSFLTTSRLMVPFDVHIARQSRRLGLLVRKSNDWKAVEELTGALRLLDPEDPSRYDYSLFGLGALGYKIPDQFILNPRVS